MSKSNAEMISESRGAFNARALVSRNMDRMLANICVDLALQVVEECSALYGFDSSEAIRLLNLGAISLEEKPLRRKEKVVKERRAREKLVPLPFNGAEDSSCCSGLSESHGLYIQCKNKKEEADFCKSCMVDAIDGKPKNGTIEGRLSVGMYEFKAPNGKSPVHYTKVMKKLKLTKEEVLAEAGKKNIEINELHFTIPEKKKGRPKSEVVKEVSSEKKKGRPKKSKKVLEIETNDIFASLIAATNEESDNESVNSVDVAEAILPKKNTEKEEEKLAKEAEKKKKEEEKLAKEAEKKKKEEEKVAKEAEKKKKEEEKVAKEAEKKKKEEEKLAKEAEKKKKEEEKVAKSVKPPAETPSKEVEEIEEPKEKYVIINAKGHTKKTGLKETDKKFLKGAINGTILSFTTQNEVGVWNKDENRIVFNEDYVETEDEAEEDSEEEEEEYDT